LHYISNIVVMWIFSIRLAAFHCKRWYNCIEQSWGEESDASRGV